MDLGIHKSDRILVLGATGWFGRCALRLLASQRPEAVMCIASNAREFKVGNGTYESAAWNSVTVAEFRPTIVLNFAFLTREKWTGKSDSTFEELNRGLIAKMSQAVALPDTRLALTLSSGATLSHRMAESQPDNPYGLLKLLEEDSLQKAAGASTKWIVARGWSFSGPDVLQPNAYLFSDLICQAENGSINLRSTSLVNRRYISVEDFLKACLILGSNGWSGVMESGGPLIEAGELAEEVSNYFGGVPIYRNPNFDPNLPPDDYYSDNHDWEWALEATGIQSLTIAEQIDRTATGLREFKQN